MQLNCSVWKLQDLFVSSITEVSLINSTSSGFCVLYRCSDKCSNCPSTALVRSSRSELLVYAMQLLSRLVRHHQLHLPRPLTQQTVRLQQLYEYRYARIPEQVTIRPAHWYHRDSGPPRISASIHGVSITESATVSFI